MHSRKADPYRLLASENLVKFSEEKATVTVVSITEKNSIAIWGVKPGQNVPLHTHPDGQDTWIMVRGKLTYIMGEKRASITSGQIAIAEASQIHGAQNETSEDAVFISIYSAPTLRVETV